MITKWPWTLQSQMHPIYVLLVSLNPKFHSVLLYHHRFRDTGHFETSTLNDPKNELEHYKVKCIPYMCHLYPRVPNFTPFRSTSIRFRDTGHFEKSAPHDLKMTRNTTRSKVPHKVKGTPYVWLVSIRLKFQSFSLYGPPFLSYRLFWEKCTEWHPNDIEMYKGKCTTYN